MSTNLSKECKRLHFENSVTMWCREVAYFTNYVDMTPLVYERLTSHAQYLISVSIQYHILITLLCIVNSRSLVDSYITQSLSSLVSSFSICNDQVRYSKSSWNSILNCGPSVQFKLYLSQRCWTDMCLKDYIIIKSFSDFLTVQIKLFCTFLINRLHSITFNSCYI